MMLPALPIDETVPRLRGVLASTNNAVIVAPPGAGKTTRIPPAIAAEQKNAVVLLQPRRVAARAAAARIAAEQGWRLGEEVGYHIRFDNRTTRRTKVRVLTEGILARQIQADPFLEGVGCVILDEFHERSIHTDLAIALLREIQSTVREDLRLIVMSATMDPAPVSRFLGNAPILESMGRLFPIEYEYLSQMEPAFAPEKIAEAIRRALDHSECGHILVFLPGMGEIRRTATFLQNIGAELHFLHSSISSDEQDRALRPGARRKIILATNIAETSLTIEGVRTVIDTGLVRVLVNDVRLGIDRLELRRVSRASADQRAGRAGRTAPGRCIRLWTRGEEAGFDAHESPEVERIDLASTILTLKAYGVRDLRAFNWFEPPPADALARAEKLLWMIGALNREGDLTGVGHNLAAFPLHPRLGRLLLAGAREGHLREASEIAALLSERDLIASARQNESRSSGPSDLLERLDLLHRQGQTSLDPQGLRAVERVSKELYELAKRAASE